MLNRNKLIEDIANNLTDGADIKTLVQFYFEEQCAYMETLSDYELIQFADDYLCDFEEEDYQAPSQ